MVEVSDTSLPIDRGVKVPLSAAGGIDEVWVVDIDAAAVHVYSSPSGSAYAETETVLRPAMQPIGEPATRYR